MRIHGTGKLSFKACDFKNVMYLPDLTTNLLSVEAITDNGEVTFTKDKVIIKLRSSNIKRTKLQNELFGVHLELAMKEKASLRINGAEQCGQATIWHGRLGHINREGLKRLIELTDGMEGV